MNKGETPNGADTPKPVIFSSGNTANSASSQSFFSTSNQVAPAPAPKKRWPLILGIVLGVLLIGGIAASAFLLPGSGSVPANSLEAKFNTFANYLLFGEEKSDKLPEYDEDKVYRVVAAYGDYDSDESREYFKKLNLLFDDFLNSYQSGPSSETVNRYIDSYRIVQDDFSGIVLPEEEIIKSFIDDGPEGAETMISGYYQTKKDEPLVETYQKTDLNYVAILSIYQQSGCIDGYVINDACVEAIADVNLQNLINSQDSLFETISNQLDASMSSITEDVWAVATEIGDRND